MPLADVDPQHRLELEIESSLSNLTLSNTEQPRNPAMGPRNFSNLAPELLFLVADNLDDDISAIFSLILTNRYLHLLLIERLYTAAAKIINRPLYLDSRWRGLFTHPSTIPRLLEAGMSANICFKQYYVFSRVPILLIAVHHGNYALAKELIACGADVNQEEGSGPQTALLEAVWKGDKAMVLLLLENGAVIEAKNPFNVSPLQLAVKYEDRRKTFGEDKVIRVMLDHGADPRKTLPSLWKGLDDYEDLIRDYDQIPTHEVRRW
jgi:hypothetical protein